jgi:hypothetical protein
MKGSLFMVQTLSVLLGLQDVGTWVLVLAGIIIPPLPEKNVVQKYQMTSEFIEQRRQALHVYVNRVVSSG